MRGKMRGPPGRCLLQTRVHYQRPGILRVLHRISAVPRTALFCTEISDIVPGICLAIYSAWVLYIYTHTYKYTHTQGSNTRLHIQ